MSEHIHLNEYAPLNIAPIRKALWIVFKSFS